MSVILENYIQEINLQTIVDKTAISVKDKLNDIKAAAKSKDTAKLKQLSASFPKFDINKLKDKAFEKFPEFKTTHEKTLKKFKIKKNDEFANAIALAYSLGAQAKDNEKYKSKRQQIIKILAALAQILENVSEALYSISFLFACISLVAALIISLISVTTSTVVAYGLLAAAMLNSYLLIVAMLFAVLAL